MILIIPAGVINQPNYIASGNTVVVSLIQIKQKHLTMETTRKYRMGRLAAVMVFCFINSLMVVGQNNGITITSVGTDEKVVIIDDPERFSEAYRHYQAGIRYEEDGDYDNAIKEFNMAIKLNQDFSEAYDRRGVVYTKLIKYRKAIKDFNKSLNLNKSSFEAYNHRGIAYYCLGEFDKAIEDYNKALEINPAYAKVYYNRGILKMYMDNEQGAIKDLEVASQFNDLEARKYLSQIVNQEVTNNSDDVPPIPFNKVSDN